MYVKQGMYTANSSHQTDNQSKLLAVSGDGSVSTTSTSSYRPSASLLHTHNNTVIYHLKMRVAEAVVFPDGLRLDDGEKEVA